jgi:hypothetical protein
MHGALFSFNLRLPSCLASQHISHIHSRLTQLRRPRAGD